MENRYFDVVYARDLGAIRLLLQSRASERDSEHASAGFRAAICSGLDDVVAVFLAEGIDLDGMDSSGLTPLTWAASSGRLGIVRRLLAAGCNVDRADYQDMTALHYAAARQDQPMARLLVEAGAALTCRNCEGKTPLDVAGWQRFQIPAVPLIGPGSGAYRRLWDSPAAKYLRRVSRGGEQE